MQVRKFQRLASSPAARAVFSKYELITICLGGRFWEADIFLQEGN